MKIAILEDERDKLAAITSEINKTTPNAEITHVANWLDYSRIIAETKFDLIILDLLVPRSGRDPSVEDHHIQLVETTRDYKSKSFFTPAIVLTRHANESEEFLYDLNKVDINVISFNENNEWKEALKLKLISSQPKKKFEFVIMCALKKEVDAYEEIVDSITPYTTISGLLCREVTIDSRKGVIVLAHRMGLVAAAVTATMALEKFCPRLICMSGICGGIPNNSEIYDLIITDVCHQHDAGKWSDSGFKSEHHDIQIERHVKNKLFEIHSDKEFQDEIIKNLNAKKSEIPNDKEEVICRIRIESTSSGSAVIAEEGKTENLAVGQRKLAGFEMEIFSVYEAARNSGIKPIFFAAKTVVDDGSKNKGDNFHRIACLLSAKLINQSIKKGIIDIDAE